MTLVVEHVTPNGRVRVPRGTPLRPLDLAGRERAAGCFKLAFKAAHTTAERNQEADFGDLIGVALLALVEGASRYEEARQVPFPVYATMVIHDKLTTHVQALARRGRVLLEPLADAFPDHQAEEPDRHDE